MSIVRNFGRVIRRVVSRGVPRGEESWRFNGVLSRYREWHAFAVGFTVLFFVAQSSKLRREVRREPQYVAAGCVIGWIVGVLFRVGVLPSRNTNDNRDGGDGGV